MAPEILLFRFQTIIEKSFDLKPYPLYSPKRKHFFSFKIIVFCEGHKF